MEEWYNNNSAEEWTEQLEEMGEMSMDMSVAEDWDMADFEAAR